ncbi:MAG: hypothetical protein ACLTX3_07210 [Lachnospiraceae bacterium]
MKKTVDNNRGLQIFLILAGIVAAGAIVIALVFSHGHKKRNRQKSRKKSRKKRRKNNGIVFLRCDF